MKKKLLTSVLLSAVILSQGAALVNVKADSTDDKIAAQNSKIDSLTNQQKAAQAQVDEIQKQVSAIQKQQEVLQAENEKLNAESAKLTAEIEELSKNIVARNESLANQARSAQTSGTATSYINTIINSASITEAISRVAAMKSFQLTTKCWNNKKKIKKKLLKNRLLIMKQSIQSLQTNKNLQTMLKR